MHHFRITLANIQGVVVGRNIPRMIFLQRKYPAEAVAASVKEEGGEQARGSAVPVVVGMDGYKLVMGQRGHERNRQLTRAS